MEVRFFYVLLPDLLFILRLFCLVHEFVQFVVLLIRNAKSVGYLMGSFLFCFRKLPLGFSKRNSIDNKRIA